MAEKLNICKPRVIGWDFPHLSQEQISVYHMHGYTAALLLPDGMEEEIELFPVERQNAQNYVTITITNPMENPFHLISNAYKSVFQYINVNRYVYDHFAFESQYLENNNAYMKIYVAIYVAIK